MPVAGWAGPVDHASSIIRTAAESVSKTGQRPTGLIPTIQHSNPCSGTSVGAGLGCATLGSPHHDERIAEFGQKWREATIERCVNLSIQPDGTRWLRNFPARKI